MNKHLRDVREFRDTFSLPQAAFGTEGHLSDMDIVMRQAWLMEAGSGVLHALKKGDMGDILVRLIELAYCALGAIAMRGEDVIENPVLWRHDGSVLSVMRLVSDKIHCCSSGKTEDYSAVYSSCAHLASGFLNADFDKALQMFHTNHMDYCKRHDADFKKDGELIHDKTLDLSEYLYE
jgi:hypothetical protein